ncbi:LysR family transcriptional regulator [Rhodococcus sp. HNM0563]|uniref:LysR substrate-binding domain-containing protein n=1 Tax=unclassified Rhodococcus (in: high G+C Gram-positive bacteria) TaxID=192944 RepID=UPI00146BFD62|nr:LysR family transcriptional regulator [Rhodococcus sp. F64268]MCK0091603.1 LysR family transcriptional regulator [Rhodococcus sp. F64268]NLU63518.1 LysR family transcriptional regulator [Rhodococcus sp. HNM0563]
MELRRVDLNLLVVLDVLLTECNVTKAARRLNMSQPATSTALARLRKQFDDPLLVKSGRTLRPTPRALALAEPLRRVLSTVERSILTVPEFDPATAERAFTLLTGDYSEVTLLRNLLRRNRYRSHGIRFDMHPLSMAGIEAFHSHEVDLAVVPEQLLATSEFEQCRRRVVLHDRYVGVVWSGHPYAGIELTADVLAGYPLLSYLQYGGDKSLSRTLSRAGIGTRPSATTTNIAVLPYVLEMTDLVTIIPERMARRIAGVAQLRILEPNFSLPAVREWAVWHEEFDDDPGHRWLRTELSVIATPDLAAGLHTTRLSAVT